MNTVQFGDVVEFVFWPMVSNVCGVVLQVPASPGECWVIQTDDGEIVYVQHFAVMHVRRAA